MKHMFLLLFTALLSASDALAEGGHPLMSSEEKDIQLKVKKKMFPGGRDEEPLKVQSELPTPIRKINPIEEAASSEPASND